MKKQNIMKKFAIYDSTLKQLKDKTNSMKKEHLFENSELPKHLDNVERELKRLEQLLE